MYKIDVSLDDNSYGIFIKKGIFQSIAEHIFRVDKYSKIFIISQKSIIDIYNPHFLLAEDILCIEENEAGKTLNQAHRIIKVLIEKGCNRSSLIIGFGGGVVTDFTGFISSIFMRGIDHTPFLDELVSSKRNRDCFNNNLEFCLVTETKGNPT